LRFCTLVSAFCLLASVGLAGNVGVDTILAPSGTVDSGRTVAPRCIVANLGTGVESLWAFFRIDDYEGPVYHDSLRLADLEPGARETVAFNDWGVCGRDSMSAIAWTVCAGDTFPGDDTARQSFLVQVKDVAITQILHPAPDTTLDSGDMLYMRCRVWNYGNVSVNFLLRFRIYKLDSTVVYEAFKNVNLIAGGATIVTAPSPWVLVPGAFIVECYAIVPGDLHPENNLVVDTFYVRRTTWEDVGITKLLINPPPDSIHVNDLVTIAATVVNFSSEMAAVMCLLRIRDSCGALFYADSANLMLGPKDSVTVHFRNFLFSIPGDYPACCSLAVDDEDSTNNFRRVVLHVLPAGAVADGPGPRAAGCKLQATVLKTLPPGAVAFDAMGRRVLNPKSGVYFIREGLGVRGQGLRKARKIVIQR